MQLLKQLSMTALATCLMFSAAAMPRAVAADSVATDTVKTEPTKERKKPSEYETLMKKGGTELKGLFTVRHIEDKWYFEIPDTMLGRYFLAVTRYTAVPQGFGKFSGEEVSHVTVYFEQRDDKTLLLRSYVLSQIADENDKISRTLTQSTIDPIVSAFKVIGRNHDTGDQLVEVTSLFKRDNNLTSMSSTDKSTLKLGGLTDDRTFIDTMKVFPINIEVVSTRTYSTSAVKSAASRTGSVTLGLNTSIVLLPKEPMRKRLWDDRVGYFVNQFTRFSDDQHKSDRQAFISRYRLVPKNLKKYQRGELVEPVKQIVYYIDPATPKKWVPYLIQGINDWNAAFEAAGFKNAIVAKPWPDDPDMSLEDARYCVLRYLPSETENAYGPRIVDPRSGEIIESHICWYHNVMNLLKKWYMVQCGPLDKRAQTMRFDDELMGQLIRFVSSHEVGHTLGLRHNMGASFATPVEKLRDKQWVEAHGHTASIMDYARFNWVAQPEDNVSPKGLFPRINDYDKWAIKWGYQYRPEFKDEYDEFEKLKRETTAALRAGGQRLWFGGEGKDADPRAQTEDLSDNNMKAAEYGIKNLKRVMANLPAWTKQENDEYDDLEMMFKAVHSQFERYMNHVYNNIGVRYHNNLPGQEPVVVVPASRQREAVSFIGRHVLDAPEWLYPAAIISKTGTDPTADNQSRQDFMLTRLLSVNMLSTLSNQAVYATEPYPVDQYLDDVFDAVWKPLNDKNEWKNKARRQLQRSYLNNLNKLVNPTDKEKTALNFRSYNSDAMLYVVQHLNRVEEHINRQLAAADKSTVNALHYQDLAEQMQLIRERRKSVKP